MKDFIIITGAYGQDGLILSKILKKKNYNIIGLVKRLDKNRGLDDINYISLNLDKKKEIKKLIKKKKIKTIVHFASNNEPYINKSNLDYLKYYEKNYKITQNLIESIIEIDKEIQFLFAGSSQMLKSNNKNIVNINSKYDKSKSNYIKYKIDSEKLLFRLKKKFSLKITSMILFNHDSLLRSNNFLIKRIVNYAKNGNINELKILYRLNIKGDFSHAEDINYAIYLLLKNKNLNIDRIILSSNKLTKINSFIIKIIKKFNLKKTFKNVRVSNNNNYKIGNNKLAIKKLKWKPKKNLNNIINNIKYE